MNKYFVLFRIPVKSMDDWMKNVPADERKKQSDDMMAGWKTWMQKNAGAILDKGNPLGKTKTVTEDGITDSRNDLNYYIILQASSHSEAAKIVSENPHVQIPTSFVDVIEIPHTGM